MSEEFNKDTNTEEKAPAAPSGDLTKACAILAYFAIGIIWYFVDENMRKSDFVKFHVKQALGLIIADIVLMTALFASFIGIPAVPLLKLAVLVLAVIGILSAVNGEKKELPVIGSYSSRYLKF